MKNHLIVLLFIGVALACSKQNSNKSQLQTHKEAVDTLRLADVKDTLIKFTYLKDATLLDTMDLSDLLFYKDDLEGYGNNYNGFFGADNYRIEVNWQNVVKDSVNARLYHVEGKTRFKGNIASFKGEILIDSLFEFIDPQINMSEFTNDPDYSMKSYEVKGRLTMTENPKLPYAGVFTGDFLMDFYQSNTGEKQVWYFSPNTPTQGGGFISKGTWKSNNKQATTKPYVFGKDFFMFANSILKDFSYGERDIEINKKYLNLGWDGYWENDEWWVSNPKPVM